MQQLNEIITYEIRALGYIWDPAAQGIVFSAEIVTGKEPKDPASLFGDFSEIVDLEVIRISRSIAFENGCTVTVQRMKVIRPWTNSFSEARYEHTLTGNDYADWDGTVYA